MASWVRKLRRTKSYNFPTDSCYFSTTKITGAQHVYFGLNFTLNGDLSRSYSVCLDNGFRTIRKTFWQSKMLSGQGAPVRLVCNGSGSSSCGWLVVAHQWLVVAGRRARAVVHLPAQATVVAETAEVTTEVDAGLTTAHVARRLLQVRVDLNLRQHQRARSTSSILRSLESR